MDTIGESTSPHTKNTLKEFFKVSVWCLFFDSLLEGTLPKKNLSQKFEGVIRYIVGQKSPYPRQKIKKYRINQGKTIDITGFSEYILYS